jgi:hypothetical protein
MVIMYVVSYEISGKIPKFKSPHDIWMYIWSSDRPELTLFYYSAIRTLMRIELQLSPAKTLRSELISAIETNSNWIAHLLQSTTAGLSSSHKIVKNTFSCLESKRAFLLD